GSDLPAPPESAPPRPAATADQVLHQFADLEALARSIPAVMECVPPFSFSPPVDVLNDEREVLVQVAAPGVDPKEARVQRTGELVVISGVRQGQSLSNGRTYFHAEIPRGPFHRVVRLPFAMLGEPRIESSQGLIEIHFPKASAGRPPAR